METPPFYRLSRRLQSVTVISSSGCDTGSTVAAMPRDDDVRNTASVAPAAPTQTPSLLATATTTATSSSGTAATTTQQQLVDKRSKRLSAEDPAKLPSTPELLVILSVSLSVCVSYC